MTHTLGNYLDKNQNYIYDFTRLRFCSLQWAGAFHIYSVSSLCWDLSCSSAAGLVQRSSIFSQFEVCQLKISNTMRERKERMAVCR